MRQLSPGTPSKSAKEALINIVNEKSQRSNSGGAHKPRPKTMRGKNKSGDLVHGTIESEMSAYVRTRGKSHGA